MSANVERELVSAMALRGEEHPMSKLSREQVLSIHKLAWAGWGPTELARQFNISPRNVYGIKRKLCWVWLFLEENSE